MTWSPLPVKPHGLFQLFLTPFLAFLEYIGKSPPQDLSTCFPLLTGTLFLQILPRLMPSGLYSKAIFPWSNLAKFLSQTHKNNPQHFTFPFSALVFPPSLVLQIIKHPIYFNSCITCLSHQNITSRKACFHLIYSLLYFSTLIPESTLIQ